jgi:Phosphotransferase enzyme family
VVNTPARLLDRIVARAPFDGHDGRSGARLDRAVLDDGTRVVVKTAAPGADVAGLVTGDPGREVWLWRSAVLDRLPAGVGHSIVDAWQDEDGTVVVVMRDLGDAVVGWRGPVSRQTCRRLLAAAATVHRRFAGEHLPRLCPLERRLTALSPALAALDGGGNPLPGLVVRGWELFAEIAPSDVAAAVFAVFEQPGPLASALRRGGTTLLHGDLWLVNVALTPAEVVLLDWGLATAGPPAVELASFLAGNASSVHATREQVIDDFRRLEGDLHDEDTLRLALFGGLVELGWNKALDIATSPDPALRARERADLDWWVAQARRALETGSV